VPILKGIKIFFRNFGICAKLLSLFVENQQNFGPETTPKQAFDLAQAMV
jgi:hypothetical protein